MDARDSIAHTKIRDAEDEIGRPERMVTTPICVSAPIAIATYSAILCMRSSSMLRPSTGM
jgi:hypothetical protein